MNEPEKITIVEGPTPNFQRASMLWPIGIYQGYEQHNVGWLQLRTGNGEDIRDRCVQAWREKRTVELDYRDDMLMEQSIDVVALRLTEVDEGMVLNLWVHLPIEEESGAGVADEDDDDGFSY